MLYPVGLSQLANLYPQPDLPIGILHCQISEIWRLSKAFGSENYRLALSGVKHSATVFAKLSKFEKYGGSL